MRSTFSTIFYLKRQVVKKDGTVPIMGRITVDGTQTQFSCKLTIDPKIWETKTGRATGRSTVALETNRMLDKIRVKINTHYQEIMDRDNFVTAEKVKNAFLGLEHRCHTLMKVYEQFTADYAKMVEAGMKSKKSYEKYIFIQECKNEKSKQAVISALNEGRVRVLFGSTSMLGTGVNAQKRAVCIHHLDTPWRPSDLTQRDGRAVRKGNEIAKLYADNKVDVIIYAVEKSLDSYKFNLLHCKQTFISQLKSGAMGARTIDEGAMDEKSGMNFSEYMAILSGNTDLLDKAKLEKKITALESERKSFNKAKAESNGKLQTKAEELDKNRTVIEKMSADFDKFVSLAKTDKEGKRLNGLKLDGISTTDEKVLGTRLQEIAQNANTEREYKRIGEIYGFPVSVISESVLKDGLTFVENRFVVEGSFKYKFNNGHLAMADTKAAATNFLNALERIPNIIAQYKEKNEALKKDIPLLQEVVGKTWKKEEELKGLKSELAALERKIQLELAPPMQEEKKEEGQAKNEQEQTQSSVPEVSRKGMRI